MLLSPAKRLSLAPVFFYVYVSVYVYSEFVSHRHCRHCRVASLHLVQQKTISVADRSKPGQYRRPTFVGNKCWQHLLATCCRQMLAVWFECWQRLSPTFCWRQFSVLLENCCQHSRKCSAVIGGWARSAQTT